MTAGLSRTRLSLVAKLNCVFPVFSWLIFKINATQDTGPSDVPGNFAQHDFSLALVAPTFPTRNAAPISIVSYNPAPSLFPNEIDKASQCRICGIASTLESFFYEKGEFRSPRGSFEVDLDKLAKG